ncbi:type II toxin-antitoxin system Phd/YefM family antitoxin [Rickettsia endosymbiont of Rhinocyllus conicus]|uniref:type II toxin-antitoxin system Phd/YefM family antitoxin n=1 Tax=Rickettsia endosymbiont of Rhinocyllus conicus TaxID=3066252 RepID=UPI003132C655
MLRSSTYILLALFQVDLRILNSSFIRGIHKPIYIKGKKSKVVLISEEDYRNMEETLYLLSIPNMHKSITEGRKEPIEKCSNKLDW